jgi:hypothetical protein
MSDALSAAVAALGLRLQAALDGLPGLTDESRAFLRRLPDAGPRPATGPLRRLAAGLRLTPLEVDLLLLAGMPEEHEGYAALLRQIHPQGEPRPTVGLAARLLCQDDEERALLRATVEGGRAVRSGALVIAGEAPLFERSLLLGDALWSALHGVDAWPRSASFRREPAAVAGLDEWLAEPGPARAVAAVASGTRCTVLVTADEEAVAHDRGAAVAVHAGVLPAQLAPATDAIGLACVHALVRGNVPVLTLSPQHDTDRLPEPKLADFPGPVVLCARNGAITLRSRRPVLAVQAEPLRTNARRMMWSRVLPELADSAPLLAARGIVEPRFAEAAAADVRALEALDGRTRDAAAVSAAVRARAGLSLAGGVKLVRPTATWGDLVLPAETERRLRDAADRLRHQTRVLDDWGFLAGRPGARGVRMLLSGPPGTGKTLSAEVLAHELGVDLLLVDIARIVSKWIGETEKNLAEVFAAAERSQAVLFFDEADALFGRRTEVADAHDRYANLETAYLLTRLERFEGLAVLSTNLRQNVDPAFMRRLEFVIELEEPARPEREALWHCHLPERAPLADDVDVGELASRYPLVGGLIRNAAVAAGFLAAADGGVITRTHLDRSLRLEYEKSGRPFPTPAH